MDKNNLDFQGGFSPYDMPNDFNMNMNDMYKDPMFSPVLQYEQAYMYYRYLNMQMEYKIKCKEYEKMTAKDRKKSRVGFNFPTLPYHLLYNILYQAFHLVNIAALQHVLGNHVDTYIHLNNRNSLIPFCWCISNVHWYFSCIFTFYISNCFIYCKI